MAVSKKKYSLYTWLVVIVLLIAAGILFLRKPSPPKTIPSSEIVLPLPPKDTIPLPDSMQWLPDSTRIFLMKDARLIPVKNYAVRREIKLDGDVFFEVPDASAPFIINTKLLVL